MAKSKKPGSGKAGMPAKKAAKKPIEQYQHKDKQRANNPPVGLVKPAGTRTAQSLDWRAALLLLPTRLVSCRWNFSSMVRPIELAISTCVRAQTPSLRIH
jgi:hypothetical protein